MDALRTRGGRVSRWGRAAIASLTVFLLMWCASGSIARADGAGDLVERIQSLPWIAGPGEGKVGDVATLSFGSAYRFLEATGTSQFLELNGNLPTDRAFTLAKKDLSWFAVFSFDESGYVKDDETIDPDVLLKQLQENNRAADEERRKRGLRILKLEGWFVPPRYDVQTKRLEWGTRLRPEDNPRTIVNFTTRLLGRRGVMAVTLVSDPETLEQDMVEFKKVLQGFGFNAGEKYAEFRQGDKVAEYGLAALIAGGAAAAVAKSGAGKALFKVLGIAAIAGLSMIGALFKKLFGKKS